MRVRFSSGYDQALCLLLPLFLFSFFSGCNRSSEELPVVPPVTNPLVREYIGYGVVNVSFTHLLSEPESGGVSMGYLRRGTVVRIIERRPVINQGKSPAVSEFWVLVEGNYDSGSSSRGWLQESALEIYDSESQAKTASKAMNL